MKRYCQIDQYGNVVVTFSVDESAVNMPDVDPVSGLRIYSIPDWVEDRHLPMSLVMLDGVFYVTGDRPNHPCRYNPVTGLWEDTRQIDEVRASKWSQIKSSRNQAETSGFTWDGSTFDSDPNSQQRIQGAVQIATLAMINNQPFSIDWTLADNSVRTLNAQEMIAVGAALANHVNAVHQRGRQIRAQIESATTLADLESIAWAL